MKGNSLVLAGLSVFVLGTADGGLWAGEPPWNSKAPPFTGTVTTRGVCHAQWHRFIRVVTGEAESVYGDLAPDFRKTAANRGRVLAGNEEFWSALLNDLKNARRHIHIQMFWVKKPYSDELLKILGERARSGVEVRLLFAKADNDYKNPREIMEASGCFENIDAVIVKRDALNPLKGVEHRKTYVIDGKIAYVTGYTVDKAMRESMFDMALRVEGPAVAQLQMNFFLNFFLRAGPALRARTRAGDFEQFFAEYFPRPGGGTVDFKILQNIPGIKSEVSDSYIHMVKKAKRKILVSDQYFAWPRFTSALNEALQRGVEVWIIGSYSGQMALQPYLRTQEKNMRHWEKLGARISLLPEFVHAKVLAVDGARLSLGSTNRDAVSFTGNLELNLYSESPRLNRDFEKRFMLHFARGRKSTSAYTKRENGAGNLAAQWVETSSREFGEGVIDLPLVFQRRGKSLFSKGIDGSMADAVMVVMETRIITFANLPSRIDIGKPHTKRPARFMSGTGAFSRVPANTDRERDYPEGYSLFNKGVGRFHFTENGKFEFLVSDRSRKQFSASPYPERNHPLFPEIDGRLGGSPVLSIDLVKDGTVLRFHQERGWIDVSIRQGVNPRAEATRKDQSPVRTLRGRTTGPFRGSSDRSLP